MPFRHPLPALTREVRPLDMTRDNTCLLLQDVHAPFADPDDGWIARFARDKVLLREFDEYFDMVRLIANNILAVLVACRDAGIPVIYTCLGHRLESRPSAFEEATGWRWDLDGPDGRFPPGLEPTDAEPVFAKPGWGALASEEFERYVRERSIRNVIIAGMMLDFGIRQTCYEFGDRGLGSLVISDAVASLTHDGQSYTSGNMAHGLTKLRTTGEFLDLLKELREQGKILV